MKTGHYMNVEAIPQSKAGTQKTVLRWLISNEDGAENFSMRLVTIEPGGFVGMHSHPYEHEVFVLKGKGLAKEGETSAEISEGVFVYIPPDVVHGFENTGEEDLEFICCIPGGKR